MKDTCCTCQKSIDKCKSWSYMPCQHGICFTCLQSIITRKKEDDCKYIIRCPICGSKWYGCFRDYKNVYNDDIIIKDHSNITIIIPFLRKMYYALTQLGSTMILFYLLITSVYQSSIMVIFTGLLVNMFGSSGGEKWWLASIMMLISIYTYDWKPLWYGFLWDLMLTYKPWILLGGRGNSILFT